MTSRASIYIKAYNRHNSPTRATDEYTNHRMTDDGYWDRNIVGPLPDLATLLHEAANLIATGDDPETMCDVYEFLRDCRRPLRCKAWVFYETHVDPNSDTWDGKRGLYGGCTTEEQAVAFMEAERDFWVNNPRNKHRAKNTWAVAYEDIVPHMMWEPEFTVEEFKLWLRRTHT